MYGEINVLKNREEAIVTLHIGHNENHSQFLCVAIAFYGGFPKQIEIKPSIVHTWSNLNHTTWVYNFRRNDVLAIMNAQTTQARSWVFDGRNMKIIESAWQGGPEITVLAKLKPVDPPGTF